MKNYIAKNNPAGHSLSDMKTSVGTQLLVIVFLVYMLIAGIITIFHLTSEYKFVEQRVKTDLGAFAKSFEPGIAYALWYVDDAGLQSMANGMVESPSVVGVKIEATKMPRHTKISGEILKDGNVIKYDSNGMLVSEPGLRDAKNLWSIKKPIIYNDDGIQKRVGEMTIYSSSKIVMSRVRFEFVLIIIDAVIKTAALWIIFWLFCNSMLSKPLGKFISEIRNLDFDRLDKFKLHSKKSRTRNEFQILEESFSAMVAKLDQTFKEQAAAKTELQKFRNYLQNVVDSMPSGIVGADAEGNITQWSRQSQEYTGVNPEDALGKNVSEMLPNFPDLTEIVKQTIKLQKVQTYSKFKVEHEDRIEYFDVTIYPLTCDSGSQCDSCVIRIDDVSKRVHLDEIMVRSEKMVSIGGLAAGMAHEINNPLAGISQNMQLVKNRLSKDFKKNLAVAQECNVDLSNLAEYLEKRAILDMFKNIDESTERAINIVKNMLSFSRKNDFANHNLADLLDQTVELVANDYELKKQYDFKKIIINREYSQTPVIANVEPGQVQQVFFNLLKNGAQAMNEISDPDFKPAFTLRIYQQNSNAVVEIENNGPPIPERVRKQIFEPFFTTKAVGIGTGLGLSVSHFIVHEVHKGIIDVANIPQGGVKFVMKLPENREK